GATPTPTPYTTALVARVPNLGYSLSANQVLSATEKSPPLVQPVVEGSASAPVARKSAPMHSPTRAHSTRTPSIIAPRLAVPQRQRFATSMKSVSCYSMVQSVRRSPVNVQSRAMSAEVSSLSYARSPQAIFTLVSRARLLFSRRCALLADAARPKDLHRQVSATQTRASARKTVIFVARPSPRSASSLKTPFTAALVMARPRWRRWPAVARDVCPQLVM
ncbi:hypothetical protein BGZ70_003950, partial [Mortierella alpina]